MMLRYLPQCLVVAALGIAHTNACDDCYGPTDFITHDRVVRRMQPDAQNAAYGPTRELEWGQINFMHTTDTHGWLEGHIKEQNYGADWGDFVSFTRHMKAKAQKLGVDLLLVDTGRLLRMTPHREATSDIVKATSTTALAFPTPPLQMVFTPTRSLRTSTMTSSQSVTTNSMSPTLPMKRSTTSPRISATAT